MSRTLETLGAVTLTAANLAILATLVLVVMPRLDRNAAEQAAQSEQLRANFRLIGANHRLLQENNRNLERMSEQLRRPAEREEER